MKNFYVFFKDANYQDKYEFKIFVISADPSDAIKDARAKLKTFIMNSQSFDIVRVQELAIDAGIVWKTNLVETRARSF
jgi:predicted anti-sigma-YlaC factor YlaD